MKSYYFFLIGIILCSLAVYFGVKLVWTEHLFIPIYLVGWLFIIIGILKVIQET